MDTKVALDMEIAVFRRLLESEEDRLGILGPEGEQSSLETSQYGLTFLPHPPPIPYPDMEFVEKFTQAWVLKTKGE